MIMLLVLASVIAHARKYSAAIPLFMLALLATAIAFAVDITSPLTISL